MAAQRDPGPWAALGCGDAGDAIGCPVGAHGKCVTADVTGDDSDPWVVDICRECCVADSCVRLRGRKGVGDSGEGRCSFVCIVILSDRGGDHGWVNHAKVYVANLVIVLGCVENG